MTTGEKIFYKKKLLEHCLEIIDKRIQQLRLAMDSAQAAANAEEKGSAGDKYETSRAMNHIQKDLYGRQLGANQLEIEQLMNINCSTLYTSVSVGSIVECTGADFFIAAGLGKIKWADKEIYLVSPAAPLAKLLMGKQVGDAATFNNKNLLIKKIY